jgi:N-methylhydantoinase B
VRAALRDEWADGVVEHEKRVDSAGGEENVYYHVRVEKRGDRLMFDFTRSCDQVGMPINVRPSIVRGCIYYVLIGLIDTTIENNGGLARVVEITVRPGSILDPVFPAPTNAYMNTSMAVAELVQNALSRLAGRQVADSGGVCGGMVMAGKRPEGGHFSTYELVGSAYGASTGKDGVSGVSALLTNALTAPIEIMENEFPMRYRRWELRVDSGGAGEFRGGLGPVREYDVLAPEAQLTLRGGKHAVPADGVANGLPAQLGDCIVNPGTAGARSLPSRFSGVSLHGGDVVRLEKSGGGGLGVPSQRTFDRVVADVIDGYVSRDSAVAVYGVDPQRLDAALSDWESVLAAH